MNRKTRKLMTINGALHPRADADRLQVTGREGGGGWMSVEDVGKVQEQSLSNYIKKTGVNLDRVFCMS